MRVLRTARKKIIKGSVDVTAVAPNGEESALIEDIESAERDEIHLRLAISSACNLSGRADTPEGHARCTVIPTPGIWKLEDEVVNELYPRGKWDETVTYIKSSRTINEYQSYAIVGEFTYTMDECDMDWLSENKLDIHSGEAHPQRPSSTGITDYFELVMGLFERAFHDRDEESNVIPEFDNYFVRVFEAGLVSGDFASYVLPRGIPPPPEFVWMARMVYPHWRRRKLERNSQRIMPQLSVCPGIPSR
ncbi:hypothetical protein M0805_004724 [Coniferiporia weirii]|nr:hypothetical protein M0805_004724 [Coniferiporia weirii]